MFPEPAASTALVRSAIIRPHTDLLNLKLYGWGRAALVFRSPPADSNAHLRLRTIG